MKVAELEGALLNYWVAKALGDRELRLRDGKCETPFHPDFDFYLFSPTVAWHEGGPIIERNNITLLDPNYCNSGQWEAYMGAFPDVTKYSIVGMVAQGAGPTPLIAAMRAYVASKFGDEVPDVADSEPGL